MYKPSERPNVSKKKVLHVSQFLAKRFPDRSPEKLNCTKDRQVVRADKKRAKYEEKES